MADPDGTYPLLEEAQKDQVDFLATHQGFTKLAEACKPFFDWMRRHDSAPDPRVVWNADFSAYTISGAAPQAKGAEHVEESGSA